MFVEERFGHFLCAAIVQKNAVYIVEHWNFWLPEKVAVFQNFRRARITLTYTNIIIYTYTYNINNIYGWICWHLFNTFNRC